jgi:hypothetical protein
MPNQSVKVSQMLVGYAANHHCRFSMNGAEMKAHELFSESVLLPVITVHAQARALRLLGVGLGCMIRPDAQGVLDVRCEVPEISMGRVADLVRALFFLNAAERIFGIERGGLIDCTPVYDFFRKPLSERIDLTQHQLMDQKWPLAQQLR